MKNTATNATTTEETIEVIQDKALRKKLSDGVRYRRRNGVSEDEIQTWISSTIAKHSYLDPVVKTHSQPKFGWTDYVGSLSILGFIGMIIYYLVPLTKKVFGNDPIVALAAEVIPIGLIVFVRNTRIKTFLSLGFGICSIGVLLVLQANDMNAVKKDILSQNHEYQTLAVATSGLAEAVKELPATWVTKRNETLEKMKVNQDRMSEIEKEAAESAEASTGKVLSWLMLVFRFFFFASALAFTHELGAKFQKWKEARNAAL